MENTDYKMLAKMLRCPEGKLGKEVAVKMNKSNFYIIQSCLEALALKNNERVLEIGFGNGIHIKSILEEGKNIEYKGIDISTSMIEEASGRYEKEIESGEVGFCLSNSKNLPFPTHAFDKVFTVNTLYFWEEPGLHLQQIRKVLKPEGIFCMGIRSKAFMQKLPFTPHGFKLYTQDEAVSLLEEQGFKIELVTYKKEPVYEISGVSFQSDAIIITATHADRL